MASSLAKCTKTLVVSAVNFTDGGPLTILLDCLASASRSLPKDWEIVALVNNLHPKIDGRVKLIQIPSAKKFWLIRLYWEWFGFLKISKKIKPTLWLSLHDITPRILAKRQVVYCHNPSPFYSVKFSEAYFEPSLLIFSLLYKFLYRIFIKKNYYIIVQQSWLRDMFYLWAPTIPIIVAHPSICLIDNIRPPPLDSNFIFIYPSLPRAFKNIETLCKASKILLNRGINNFEVRLTITGNENKYAKWIHKRFGLITQLKFLGYLSKEELLDHYCSSSALIFPSKLETWGLPITEAKALGLPLLVSDLPYARETVGNYEMVSFFQAESAHELANLMELMIKGEWRGSSATQAIPEEPFARDWFGLWKILTNGL